MRRFCLVLLPFAALTAAAGVLWWTAPPRASAGELSRVAALVPSAMDGAAVVAQPQRAARWLARRPQALALAHLAAPHSGPTMARLRPLAPAIVVAADGPLAVWWRGADAALAVRVPRGSVRALEEIAARAGLPTRTEGGVFVTATSPGLLRPAGLAPPPLQGQGHLAALVSSNGRWWRVRLGRSRLDATSGLSVQLPEPSPGSVARVADAADVLMPLLALPMPSGPAFLLVEPSDRWGLSLPAVRLGRIARSMLRFQGSTPAPSGADGVERWSGLLGEIWVNPERGVLLASHPDLVARLAQETHAVDEGTFHGRDAAWLLDHLASFAEQLPGLADASAKLRRATPEAADLDTVRWHLEEHGGSVQLTW